MPRPKKDYISLNMRVDRKAMELFTEYCETNGQTKTKAFEQLVIRAFDDSLVKVPSFPDIDFMRIAESVGKEDFYEEWDPVTLFQAEKIVMDAIFNTYAPKNYKVKEFPNKNVKVYEYKKFECFLAVYLQEGNVSYTIRLNTLNVKDRVTVLYFSVDHMAYYNHSLLFRMLNDFSAILYRCIELRYTPEGSYKDSIPRGYRITKDIPFYGEREYKLLEPCHYYSGFLSENNEYTELPFKEWLDEIRAKFTGN